MTTSPSFSVSSAPAVRVKLSLSRRLTDSRRISPRLLLRTTPMTRGAPWSSTLIRWATQPSEAFSKRTKMRSPIAGGVCCTDFLSGARRARGRAPRPSWRRMSWFRRACPNGPTVRRRHRVRRPRRRRSREGARRREGFAAVLVDLAGLGQGLQALAERPAIFALQAELPRQVADIDLAREFEPLRAGLSSGRP